MELIIGTSGGVNPVLMVKAKSDLPPVDALSIKILDEFMNRATTRSSNDDGCALSFVEVVALREILDELVAVNPEDKCSADAKALRYLGHYLRGVEGVSRQYAVPRMGLHRVLHLLLMVQDEVKAELERDANVAVQIQALGSADEGKPLLDRVLGVMSEFPGAFEPKAFAEVEAIVRGRFGMEALADRLLEIYEQHQSRAVAA